MSIDQNFIKAVVPKARFVGRELPDEISFSVDSRTISENQIFVALEGNSFDGHAFLENALLKSSGALVAEKNFSLIESVINKFITTKTIIFVEDPGKALYQLAYAWRDQLKGTIIGITGSVGKTSTKEYISSIIRSAEVSCFASEGNQNTLLGVSLNILKMKKDCAVGVFELGISATSEMESLAQLLRPAIGLITYIGHSHMEGLGSFFDIATEKRKIFSCFIESNIGIINGDQPILSQVGYPHPVIRFGQKTTNQIQARKIKTSNGKTTFILKIYNNKHLVVLPHTHQAMINNILAAVSVTYLIGIDQTLIVNSIQKLPVYKQRFEVCPLNKKKGVIIDDCYNASPESVKAALFAFEHMNGFSKKIAVLGDMLELGENSHFWHRQIGRFLKKYKSINHVLLVGSHMKAVKETAPYGVSIEVFNSWQDALERLNSLIEDDNAVLVKGSRGMQLQHIVTAFASKEKTF